jgi:predicted transcriptional regulator
MTRPLSDEQKQEILAMYDAGTKQTVLAKKFNCSNALICKMVKGREPANIGTIKKLVEAKQELVEKSEKEVKAVWDAVNFQTKNLKFLNDCAVVNVKAAMEAECQGQLDYKHRADTIIKAKETIVGKDPAVAVQVNNYKSLDEIPTGELMEMLK